MCCDDIKEEENIFSIPWTDEELEELGDALDEILAIEHDTKDKED